MNFTKNFGIIIAAIVLVFSSASYSLTIPSDVTVCSFNELVGSTPNKANYLISCVGAGKIYRTEALKLTQEFDKSPLLLIEKLTSPAVGMVLKSCSSSRYSKMKCFFTR